MDDAPTPFQPQVSLTPEEDLLEQNTREGLRALFYWAVFPFPLALIPLAWLSRLPFVGLLAGVAGLVVLIVWAMRARAAWGDKAGPWIAAAWDWVIVNVSRRTLRSYRYAGERAAHEEQARETTISLGLMAQAAADDPTQVRMASDIEHGAEARLTVLLGKPQLSLAEKRERDAIQMALQARRAGFDTSPAVAPTPRPMGFAGLPVPGFNFPFSWALAAILAVTNLGMFALWNGARDEARTNAEYRERNRQVAEQWRENAQGWRDRARRLEVDGTVTAGVLAEREAAIARARANERRARRDLENIARDTPPAWFDSVRSPGDDALGRPGSNGSGGSGSDHPG